MRLCVAVVVSLLLCRMSRADVSIVGPTKYKPHQLVRLKAVGADDKAGLLWRVYPSADVQRAAGPRGVLEFAAPPGTYDVELLAITTGEAGLSIAEARASVMIESCHPAPPTPPIPPPLPPLPPGGKLDPQSALGQIQFGNAGCTATVIGPRRPDGRWDVLTAAHCIAAVGQRGRMRMPATGVTHNVTVAVFDRRRDVCWLVTDDQIQDIEFALLAPTNPEPGVAVWHQGYGVDKPRNREEGVVGDRENADGQIRFVLSVSSGDSGGGIFRADTGQVVSAVCCTAGLAVRASMWGGSCEQAWRLRPSRSADDWEWSPAPIPICPERRPAAPQ